MVRATAPASPVGFVGIQNHLAARTRIRLVALGVSQPNFPMPQDFPRIIKGFRTGVFLKLIGLFCIPCGAMIIGAWRSQRPPDEDMFQVLLKGVAFVGGVVWFLALPYYLMIFTPMCDSCKVRTRRHGKLNHDNDEWKVTICPLCRERFMYRVFSGDAC